MTLDDLAHASTDAIAALAALTVTHHKQGGVYCTPAPCCGAERAHTASRDDKRGPVHVRDGWHCFACDAKGGRADLVALARYGRRWFDLTRDERDAVLDRPAPAVQVRQEPAPVRVPPELWAELVRACVPAVRDRECRAWAERRGLQLGGDLLAIVARPDPALPLWTSKGRWLPDLGHRMICPCYDESGDPVGARLRQVWPDPVLDIKEMGLPGFSATGLCYASRGLRDRWRKGLDADRPVVISEGKPDYLAVGPWCADVDLVGHFEGSFRGAWLKRLGSEVWYLHQQDKPDKVGKRKSAKYVEQIVSVLPSVRLLPVATLYGVVGVAWKEGDDVADLAGRVPSWSEVRRIF